MFGTIRKHQTWLLWVIAILTIVSFLIFMGQGGAKYGGNGNGFGIIYGKPVTADEYEAAKRDFFLKYWSQTGEFPDRNPNFSHTEIDKGIYQHLLIQAKAKELGIQVDQQAEVAQADIFLTTIGQGKSVRLQDIYDRYLKSEGLTLDDFEHFIGAQVMQEEMIQALGLSGALVLPQEASQLYDRQYQEYSAQAVFFSASNYLSQVTVTPSAVSQFYTNYLAEYRLPDRLQVSYVKYDLSNYMAAAEQKLGKTNIEAQANAIFAEKGLEAVPGAKSPEDAKARIRDAILRQAAAKAATDEAMQLVTPLFAMEPISPDNLATLAKKDGLTVHTTAPFSEMEGPLEFNAPSDLVKAMFTLNQDSPFIQKPVALMDGVYIIGLSKVIPSTIQPLSEIHDRVVEDFKNTEAAAKARAAGSNFFYTASMQMATGKTLAQAAIAAGQTPVALKPFSLSSKEIPEADGHADYREVLQTAFSTPVGHLSPFEATADGGFMLFVQSMLPVDQATKNADFPRFLAEMRRNRENEAFYAWLQVEANRELGNTPLADEMRSKTALPSR